MTANEYNQCVDDFADGVYRFILKNIKDEGVVLELGTSAEKPGVIRTKDRYVYVVLPMQLA